MAKRIAARAIFLLALLPLLSCTCSKDPAAALPAPWLKWMVAAAPDSLQWWTCGEKRCHQWSSLIMEGLTRPDFNDSLPVAMPALAESWTEDDATVFVFQLRRGITWSDGRPLDANDFVLTWKRALQRCGPKGESRLLLGIANAAAFCEKRVTFTAVGISAIAPDKLKVRLAHPNPQFPFYLSHPSTWPVRWENDKPSVAITLGPFRAEKVSPTHFRFSANVEYYDGAPSLGGIDVSVVPNAATRVQSFLEGETDLVDEIPPAHLGQVLGDERLESYPTLEMEILTVAATRRPFHQASFRRALAQAIDRREIANVLKWPHLPATSLVKFPAGATADPSFNADGATKLLADLKLDARFVFKTALVHVPSEEGEEIAKNLEAQWIKNLNFKVEVQPSGAGPLQLRAFTPDPYSPLRGLDEFVTIAADPVPRMRAKRLEDLIGDARAARLSDSWKEHLERIDDFLVNQEALVIPLFYRSRSVLRRAKVEGLNGNALGQWNFRSVRME